MSLQPLLSTPKLPPILAGGDESDDMIKNLYQTSPMLGGGPDGSGGQLPPQPQGGAPAPQGGQMPPQGGMMPPQAPQAQQGVPQAPVAPAPAVAPPHPHQSLLGRVHDKLMNSILGPTPAGYEGMLTPDEVASQKPGLARALFDSNAPKDYAASLDAMANRKQASAGIQRATDIRALRAKVAADNPPPTNGSEADMAQWAHKVFPALFGGGDFESVKMLQPLMEQYAQNAKPAGPGATKTAQVWQDKEKNFHYLTPEQTTQIPEGWTQVSKTTGTGGVPQLFRAPGDAKKMVWIKPGDQVPPGYKPESSAMGEYRQDMVGGRFDVTRLDRTKKGYDAEIAPYTKVAPIFNQSLKTIEDARYSKDPGVRKALFSSAIANFVQAADPKAQIRWQLLNYFKENINASAADRVKLLVTRLKDGTLPDGVLESMASHLYGVRDMMKSEIATHRRDWIKRNSAAGLSGEDGVPMSEDELGAQLPDTDIFFQSTDSPQDPTRVQGGSSSSSSAPAAKAGDLYSKYKLTPGKP